MAICFFRHCINRHLLGDVPNILLHGHAVNHIHNRFGRILVLIKESST